MRIKTIFTKIIFSFILVALLPTLFFASLIVLGYHGLITEYLSAIQISGMAVEEPLLEKLAEVQKGVMSQIWLTLFLIIILVAFSLSMIYRNVIVPIKKLIRATQKITAGNLGVKLPTKREDEIGVLFSSVNQMTKKLKKSREALEESKAVLEIRVRARTQELEEIAAGLEEKVKQRTKELRDRVKELEKFQKLTVGRELKMVELKKELKKAKQQLEELKQSSKGRKKSKT